MDSRRIDLAKYRLEKAKNCIKSAQINAENDLYSDSANRSYYAIFHTARAVMALDGEDRKKHSGVLSYFQEHYIKTNIFDKKYSRVLQDAFDVRQESDYEDFFVISYDEVTEQLEDARDFYNVVSEYIETISKTE